MAKVLEGKTAIVTGAGAGLGKAEAIELAKQGAKVVIVDIEPAKEAVNAVVEEIKGFGGEAIGVLGDVGNLNTAENALKTAVETFGDLNILVNNAGITRDKMLFNMSEEEFDSVVHVHLKGHFNFSRVASAYWRNKNKSTGEPVYARVINTASEAYLYNSPGQANYAAVKAGIVSMTMVTVQALAKAGLTANVICPRAKTAMTANQQGFEDLGPEKVAPMVAYLASPAAARVNGNVFIVWGNNVMLVNPPSFGEKFANDDVWTIESLDAKVGAYLAKNRGGYFVQPTI